MSLNFISQYICTFCMVPSDISEILCFVLQVGEFCVSFHFSKSYLYQIVLLQYHFPKHIVTKSYYYDLTNPLCIITISNISREIDYVPNEKIRSYIAPRYAELVGPVLVCWEDYRYGNKKLMIGEYKFSRRYGRYIDHVVCRDLFGVLILMMNLQLENWNNKKNRSTDSAMLKIKKSTIGHDIHVNSFGKVNKTFCQFVVDFFSMALVFDAWSSHLSQFAPAPYVSDVPAAVYKHMRNNHEIIVYYLQSTQVSFSYAGKIVPCLNFNQLVYLPIHVLTILRN